MKKLTLLLLAVVFAFSFSACAKKSTVPDVLYQPETPNSNDGITKISKTEKLDPPNTIDYTFSSTSKTKSDVESEVRAVVTAKVLDAYELQIDYEYEGSADVRYISYINIEVTDVFSDTNNELQKGSNVWIYYANTTHSYIDAMPLMQKGEEYFMFLTSMVSPFHDYGKYYVYFPQTLLFKKGSNGFYDFSKMLEVFTLSDFGLVEGTVPTIDIMHDFFTNNTADDN